MTERFLGLHQRHLAQKGRRLLAGVIGQCPDQLMFVVIQTDSQTVVSDAFGIGLHMLFLFRRKTFFQFMSSYATAVHGENK